MPPQAEKNVPVSNYSFGQQAQNLCGIPKYSGFLHFPYGLKSYFDYKEGLACAKIQGKPAFIDFKGHAFADCKIMEAKVFSIPDVQKMLSDNFIIISLYNDDRTALPEKDWIISKTDNRKKKTLGQLNADLEITLFKTNTMPLYAVIDSGGNNLVNPIGMHWMFRNLWIF